MNLCTRCRMILALHVLMLFCIDLVPILLVPLFICHPCFEWLKLRSNLPWWLWLAIKAYEHNWNGSNVKWTIEKTTHLLYLQKNSFTHCGKEVGYSYFFKCLSQNWTFFIQKSGRDFSRRLRALFQIEKMLKHFLFPFNFVLLTQIEGHP